MEFLKHLPTEIMVALLTIMFGLMAWAVRIIYKLILVFVNRESKAVEDGFKDVKNDFYEVKTHLVRVDKKIDLLTIEIKSSDFASDHFLSNGDRFMDIKEIEKQRLIRDYKLQEG